MTRKMILKRKLSENYTSERSLLADPLRLQLQIKHLHLNHERHDTPRQEVSLLDCENRSMGRPSLPWAKVKTGRTPMFQIRTSTDDLRKRYSNAYLLYNIETFNAWPTVEWHFHH